MPDPFTNARPYYDPTFPSSGDGFSIPGFRNAFNALGFLDALPLQPRAHSPANLSIMVRGKDNSAYYNPVYYGNADQRVNFTSGDTTNFSAPAGNPRIDIVYMTPSGDIKIQQGTVAASPQLPSLGPSGDSRFPICAVWCKPGMSKVVNFEDKDSNSGDGYIYKDLRPWMRTAGAGSATLGSTTPVSPTGDAQATPGSATTAARSDHVHGGVHAVRKVGSSNLQGDIELAGNPAGVLTQAGNRITINSPFTAQYISPQQTITAAGSLVLAHGLGATPTLFQVSIVNQIAEGNYSPGDEVIVNPNSSVSAGASRGVSIVPDATNLNIRFGSSSGVFTYFDKTTGGATSTTDANWKVVFKAWV